MLRSAIPEVVLLMLLLTVFHYTTAKENTNNQPQPLENLDKVIRQANGMKFDSMMDSKLASNVSTTLNEMAMNLRKMFMENRRLSSQVQDVLKRMQNATGVNATSAINNFQQQTNLTSLNNLSNLSNTNLSSVLSRFQGQ